MEVSATGTPIDENVATKKVLTKIFGRSSKKPHDSLTTTIATKDCRTGLGLVFPCVAAGQRKTCETG